jgi:hypothetical protein
MRRLVVVLTVLCSSTVAFQANAGEFWDRMSLDFHRMNCWPEPFVHSDRELVRGPLIAMTNSGWQLQNTLSHHFFEADTHELTRAGRLRLQWIVTQAPAHRRTVFVLRSLQPHATDKRLASVQENMNGLTPNMPGPEVLVSDTTPPGGSGDYFDNVDRQLKSSVPIPRLPPRGGISVSGGGGQ